MQNSTRPYSASFQQPMTCTVPLIARINSCFVMTVLSILEMELVLVNLLTWLLFSIRKGSHYRDVGSFLSP